MPILKACLKTSRSEALNSPPSERMETFTPVFPNGRVGTVPCSGSLGKELPRAWVSELKPPKADPIPATPAVLIKFLLEILLLFPSINVFPFLYKSNVEILRRIKIRSAIIVLQGTYMIWRYGSRTTWFQTFETVHILPCIAKFNHHKKK